MKNKTPCCLSKPPITLFKGSNLRLCCTFHEPTLARNLQKQGWKRAQNNPITVTR